MHGPVNVKFNSWFHDIYFTFHKCNLQTEMLRGVHWQAFTDTSEQLLHPFCKGPAGLECFTLEEGTDRLFRNGGK